MASRTGWTLAGDLLITRRISAVAACCSWACALSLRAPARRFSRSRTLAPSSLGDLRAPGGWASLDFAGFGPRLISLSLPLMKWPGTGYVEPVSQGKGTANRNLSLPGGCVQGGRTCQKLGGVCFLSYHQMI